MRRARLTVSRERRVRLLVGLLVAVTAGTPAAGMALDLFPTGLEVTQAIQDQAAGLRLIESRDTWVRVYVQADSGLAGGVTGQLFGELGGAGGTPVGPLGPVNPGGDIDVTASPSRGDTNRSFQFQLPPSWRTGTLRLRAVIDSAGRIAETNETNNEVERTVSFDPPLPIKVSFIGFSHVGGAAPTFADNLFAISFLMRSFPGTTVDFRGARSIDAFFNLGNDICNCPKDSSGNCTSTGTCANIGVRRCNGDADCGCGLVNEVAAFVRNTDYLNFSDFFEPQRKYYGMVGDGGGSGFMRGCSPLPGPTGAGPTGNPALRRWGSWDTDASYGDWYTAHELGHSYGRPHATCCGAQGNPADFPDSNCSLSSPGDNTYFGFDSLDQSALAPSFNKGIDGNYTDIMSYCPREWTSDFTWERLYLQLADEAGVVLPSPGQPTEYIVLRGSANLDLDAAIIGSMHRIVSTRVPFETVPGDWSIHLQDGKNNQLLEHAFTPLPLELGQPADPNLLALNPHQLALITEIIPYVPGTARVALSHFGNELDAFSVSVNTPTVTLFKPNGGESFLDKVTVEWEATDPDQEPLNASLLYSPDGGASWTMVSADLSSSPHEVDLSHMPGSTNARMRVMVSDGFNTASDDSDAGWQLDDHDPTVVPLTPDGARFNSEQNVILQAIAMDAEDGDVSSTVQWSSDIAGALGTGSTIDAGPLALGFHQITAQAIDSQNQAGLSVFDIVVTVSGPVPVLSPTAGALLVLLLCAAGVLVYLRSERLRGNG